MSTIARNQRQASDRDVERRSRPLAGRLRRRVHGRHVPRQLLARRGHADGRRGRRRRADGLRAARRASRCRTRTSARTCSPPSSSTPSARRRSRSPPTDIGRYGDDVTVDGELTIKGITQPVALTGTIADPIEDAYGNDRIGLTLETTIDRTEFGLNWNLPLPNGKPALANDVTLTAELYLVKA